MSDTMTVLPSSFVQKARSNASFLQANYSDLSAAEADVISKKLNECADRIEELERQLAERDAALARFSSVLSSVANAVEKEAFRMEAPNEHTPIFIGIANFARNNNCGLPTSAQATAKVLAVMARPDTNLGMLLIDTARAAAAIPAAL